ncbi:hypothetical protein FACUT_13374 [Fusarium acutatum]|uniref:Uncharacterized protein n=1 Tax=Fusarium acutatum TaxID=78861 RepID=A0A8H4JA63_9HYPO|nr:hypothetical protein FACUT_13374 [Fusarium acutatum]
METTHQDSPPPDSPGAPFSHPVKPQRKVTPAERKSPQLPSPPSSSGRRRASTAADELPQSLIEAKRDCETRGDVSKLTSLPLSNQDYTRLLPELEATFHRFDYDARRGRFVIRMPSRIHDLFAERISNAIMLGLSELGRDNADLLPLTAKIHKGVTSNIFLYDIDDPSENRVMIQRSPDGQFFFGSGPATVVIEVAYSQDAKLLSKVAREYINYSWGKIKAVLCFSLNKPEGSTVSVWKPRYYPEQGSDQLVMKREQVVQSEPFRTVDGSPTNEDRRLELDLHDFVPTKDCSEYRNPSIKIPYSKLYESLVEVEQLLETPRCPSPQHGVKRPCMTPGSSDESMIEEDKSLWRIKDRATRDRQSAEDGEYKGSHDGEERPAKRRSQEERKCQKSSIVELDSNEADTA